MTDRLEGLGDWDDTLDEPAARDGAPPPELAAELVRQRVAHGLLASLGRSADAAGRERFVESIFARLRDVDAAATVDADALVVHDDSLDDTVEGDGAPPAALRDELVRQRVVHGLLRAERAAREGAARDALVERIVGAAAGGRVLGFPGSWTRIAAAAAIVVAATFGLTKLLGRGGRDPRLEAASREMSKSADRRFQVMVKRIDVTPKQVTGMHDLWLRPMDDGALRFRLEVDGLRAGRQRIGSDGIKVWRTNLDDVNDREEVDVAHGDEVFRHLQDRSRGHAALDDPVHFDVGRLLRILAIDGMASAEGEPIDNGRGEVWQLFYAATLTHADFGTLTSVLVLVDEATCLIEALEFVRRDADGTFRYRFDYMSSEPQEQSIYFRPW